MAAEARRLAPDLSWDAGRRHATTDLGRRSSCDDRARCASIDDRGRRSTTWRRMSDGIGHRSSTPTTPSRGTSTATAPTTWPALLVVVAPRAASPSAERSELARHRASGSSPTRRASTAGVAQPAGRRRSLARTGAASRTAGVAAVWALRHRRARMRPRSGCASSALSYFERGARQRSPWPRAMAFAALGAAEVLARRPAPLRGAAACSPTPSAAIDRPGRRRRLAVARAAPDVRQRRRSPRR